VGDESITTATPQASTSWHSIYPEDDLQYIQDVVIDVTTQQYPKLIDASRMHFMGLALLLPFALSS